MNKPSDKETGQAALASLIKSASVGARSKPSDMDRRDMDLRQMENYRQPGWAKDEQTGKESSPTSTTLMVRLWELMTELYGHKWTSVHGLGDDSGNWGKIFSGINGQQLALGVRAWTSQPGELAKWPPGAVELREMCRAGAASHVPDVAMAWREAVNASTDPNSWVFSHPIVQEAARLTDWYSIRHGVPKAETVQGRFNKRYSELAAKLHRGEPLVDGQILIGQEAVASELERSDRVNEWLIKKRIEDQGIDKKSPEELRAELLKKMGINR